MSEKHLINLGLSPDSGTGDSARRGGEKINTLFADLYANFGDNPIDYDTSSPNYGSRKTFQPTDFKVGELHPAGKWPSVYFTDSEVLTPTANGYTQPEVFTSKNWYFLSRGEQVNLDLTDVADGAAVHIVLPLAYPGDVVKVRDVYDTWAGKQISVWTTPYDFTSSSQITNWINAQPEVVRLAGKTQPDSDSVNISTIGGPQRQTCVYRRSTTTVGTAFQPEFKTRPASTTLSPLTFFADPVSEESTEIEFAFRATTGWLMVVKKGLDSLNGIIASIDSDLNRFDSDLPRLFKASPPPISTQLNTSTITVDSWPIGGIYATVKYIVEATNTAGQRHVAEVLLTHNGTTAFVTEYAVILTNGNPIINVTADINSGNVRLRVSTITGTATLYLRKMPLNR